MNSFPHDNGCTCSICFPNQRTYTRLGRILKTQEQTINEAAFDAAMKRVENLRRTRLEQIQQREWEWFRGFASVLSYQESRECDHATT